MTQVHDFDVELITPQKAAAYLKFNESNRPLKQGVVSRYAEAITNGQWEVNGEAIKFDEEGRLLDGQHRLHAVLKCGKAIESYVIRGLAGAVFDTLDTGKARSGADTLALSGEKNYHVLAATLRILIIEEELGESSLHQTDFSRLITNKDLLNALERHPQLRYSVATVINSIGLRRLIPMPPAAYCHYRFAEKNRQQADEFFRKLAKGDSLSSDSPLLALRNKLIVLKGTRLGAKIRAEIMACTIKAWNFHRKNQPSKSLRWQEGEAFPKVM